MSAGSVVGQTTAVGTITLTAAAPSGGASIRLESNNLDAVRVPATISIPAGSTSATFNIATATVDTRQLATISATYAGVTRTENLLVTLTPPRAAFTVTSPTLGDDKCRMIEEGRQLDCRLDGKNSAGRIVKWSWTLEAEERVSADKPDPGFNEIDVDCDFVGSRTGDTDSNGRYTSMSVRLEVTDKDGDRNSSTRNVRLYFNEVCDDDDDDDDDDD